MDYFGDPKTGCVRYLDGQNVFSYGMARILNGPDFEKSGFPIVWISNDQDHRMVIQNPDIFKPNFFC